MRRAPKELVFVSEFPYKKIKPFLWTECDECQHDIKRECMWKITVKYNRNETYLGQEFPYSKTDQFYICLHCCPSISDIEKYIDDNLKGRYRIYKRIENEKA